MIPQNRQDGTWFVHNSKKWLISTFYHAIDAPILGVCVAAGILWEGGQ